MFYLKHKTICKYFTYDENNEIYWVEDKVSARGWSRECDALFTQHLWDDNEQSLAFCLWMITDVVEE